MRQRWLDFKAAVREMFTTRWPEDPDPASTTADTAARTAWIQANRHPPIGGE